MSEIKQEVLNILDVIESSTKLYCPEEIEKINDIEATKQYINNLKNKEKDKVE